MRVKQSMLVPATSSTSNTGAPGVCGSIPSGLSEGPRIALGTSPTLGCSELSFVRSLKMAAIATAVGSTVTFMNDPAMARALVREPLPASVDAHEARRSANGLMDAAAHSRDQALISIIVALDAEPVEDGMIHPAERQIAEFIRSFGGSPLYEAMFTAPPANHGRTASLLRLLGRAPGVSAELRASLLDAGLASDNLEIRDAAVQAAELWEDAALAGALRNHKEVTPWLADYIARVARDLDG